MTVDLDAYFARIGYHGGRAPTLHALNAICEAHVIAIPFENLDVLLGRPISLSDAAVDDKLLHRGRGGYCFEHNTLLHRVLRALGFEATLLSARARVSRARDETPPRTHVFVRVETEGESWLADVGVGGLSSTAAVRLVPDLEQPTPHEPRRLVREGGRWFHQARLGDAWVDVIEFTLEEMPAIDREVGHWFTSAHPASPFRQGPMVARALPEGGRVTLRGDQLTLRTGGRVDRRTLDTPGLLLDALERWFGLRFPEGTTFGAAWSEHAPAP
ncbi:MAG: arylamine N-acetyltransferase [Sandaracinus sp.]|nr:arylamine N-acetyltransferase [Sandaracinus sp.]